MKSSHSILEQEANKLWQNFKRQDQKKFWEAYEQIIEVGTSNKTISNITQTFKRSYLAYSFGYLLIFLALFTLYLNIGRFFSESNSLWDVLMSCSMMLGLFLIFPWQINRFEISSRYLHIHKPFFFFKQTYALNHIKYLIIQEDSIKCTSIKIVFTSNKCRIYSYQLPKEVNLKFRQALKQQNIPSKHRKIMV